MRNHNTRLQSRLDECPGSFSDNNLQSTNIIDLLVSCLSCGLRAISLLLENPRERTQRRTQHKRAVGREPASVICEAGLAFPSRR